MTTYTLTLAHLYPEQMNIYGDRGNIITLAQRCAWRGIALRVLPVGPGDRVDWMDVDMAFFGGGQDSSQALIANDFVQRQAAPLRPAIEDGLVLLTICGGYQLLGHYFLTHAGEKLPGAALLDLYTVGGTKRLIGNSVVEWFPAATESVVSMVRQGDKETRRQGDKEAVVRALSPSPLLPLSPSTVRLVGFENHSGRTYGGAGVRSLGRALVGSGNNGEDGTGGAVYRNTYGCYLHGSLLPKNPQLADHLIALAMVRRYGAAAAALTPLDDALELRAQRGMIARLGAR